MARPASTSIADHFRTLPDPAWARVVKGVKKQMRLPRPRALSAPIPKYAHVFLAGHPASRRCSSLEYSRYSRSSRLAIRAPRSGLPLP